MSCAPSAASLDVATRQRRESSSYEWKGGMVSWEYFAKRGIKRAYLAEDVETGNVGKQMEVRHCDYALWLVKSDAIRASS